ncbi:DgyrCDS11422 [Dimorphilus gyrociliatus]|uniref:DgyrCDS11422 n=1 Tax=Dimorphilus gyrociliatus TaxID=2664684 RepID=A0A7I8W5U1_9ANNE|nr:DgyrCDS11422 [Dimorphilus gyrociliatus]
MNHPVSHENIEIALEATDDVITITQHTGDVENNSNNPETLSSADNSSSTDEDSLGAMRNEGKSEKKSRRVSFPVDERVVSGYMEAPNPWTAAERCSTEELVEAYKRACEKQGVKPIIKLLSQLMAVSDFYDRNETLSLRGEKIDVKHCETLEEILRRVQFRTLDLEASHLEDECGIAIFDMIEYYESAMRLNISYNRLGPRGWQACSRMIKKTPCLETLEARNCQLNEQSIPFLARTIRMGCHLATLHLENSSLSGRPLMILVAAIKMNETLKEFFLADNRLMPSDGIHLGNMLKYNNHLQLLDLRNNHLQDTGTIHICSGLCEQTVEKGLLTLVLWNNQITYQSMPSLARALILSNCLETLNLGHNNIANEGIHQLKDGLLRNRSLLRIGLQAAKISCEGAIALAEYVTEAKKLLRIDMRENDIKTAGLMALSLSLKVSQSVTRLDLDREPKRETMKDYAVQQRRLLNDISNYMARNRELQQKREEQEEQERIEKELAAEKIQEEEIEQTVVEEQVIPEIKGLNRSQLHLNFSRPHLPNAAELESPAFVTEEHMITWNSEKSRLQTVAEEPPQSSQVEPEKVSENFPQSPMVSSDGHACLKPVTENTTLSPTLSPSSAKKFVVHRVKDESNSHLLVEPRPDEDNTTNKGCSDSIDNSVNIPKDVDSSKDKNELSDSEDVKQTPANNISEGSSYTDKVIEMSEEDDKPIDTSDTSQSVERDSKIENLMEEIVTQHTLLNGTSEAVISNSGDNKDDFEDELNEMLAQVDKKLCIDSPEAVMNKTKEILERPAEDQSTS